MPSRDRKLNQFAELRRQAEAILRATAAQSASSFEAHSAEDALRALHELSVHQIEMEMQHEELERLLTEVEVERAHFSSFYDSSPAGLSTLDRQGRILELNLTLARMLGLPKGDVITEFLSRFIFPGDQDPYLLSFQELLEGSESRALDLRVVTRDGVPIPVHLAANTGRDGSGQWLCRVVLIDAQAGRLIQTSSGS